MKNKKKEKEEEEEEEKASLNKFGKFVIYSCPHLL